MDPDSLIYRIKTNNLYDDVYEDKNEFDFSGYLNNSPYYNIENKKNWKMKDEMGGVLINELWDIVRKCIPYLVLT